MGMRFRKSKKIAPGVRLNLSAKSASISIGPKGFKKTFSTSGRVTTTVGIPGTGLSYSTSKKTGQTAAGSTSQEAPAAPVVASNKNKRVTLALCVFLGFFGAHRFYVGKVGTGVLYIFTVGGLGFGWIIDMVMICCNKFTDSTGAVVGLKVAEYTRQPDPDLAEASLEEQREAAAETARAYGYTVIESGAQDNADK